ncbi:hypothetical protein Y032_0081g1514 [Ancylostoma ceylanicum]|uniref:Uncharacterized protein n=1 Tax=Ancylostoma ceylanicum TaxID=53326 RepID=A0A016TSD8_9BILA|nr:hypothetical protein Y032_0081g1514 [Ancylostoma ceylanicum]
MPAEVLHHAKHEYDNHCVRNYRITGFINFFAIVFTLSSITLRAKWKIHTKMEDPIWPEAEITSLVSE